MKTNKFLIFIKTHLLSIILSSFFIAYAIYNSYTLYFSIVIKVKTLGLNFVYYWISLFNPKIEFTSQILDLLEETNTNLVSLVPENFNIFLSRLGYGFKSLVAKGYLKNLFNSLFGNLVFVQFLLSLVVILIPLVILAINMFFKPKDFEFDVTSHSYKAWNKFYTKVVSPSKEFIKGQISFLKQNSYVKYCLIFSLLIYFNLASIIIDFLAYYFYFISKFDFSSIWELIYLLLLEMTPSLFRIPLWFYILVIYYLFCKWRKNNALDILRHHDAINCGFVKGSGVLIMINGAPGAGKTLLQTDMSITCEMMFRQQAKEIMDEVRDLFPNFRYDLLRKKLDLWIKTKRIKNLVDCEDFINYLYSLFKSSTYFCSSWNYYDYEKYGLYFDNSLKHEFLFDDLLDYSKAYFIYQSDFALLISNYPIRAEHRRYKNDHMVMFDYDYFRTECFDIEDSTYSKVIDYDMLRLAKKKKEDNKNANIPIAYVFALTELGKERGNSLDNQELKKKSDETNQKNDGFTDYLRVGRHPATIRNRTFFKIFFDEQRASSCGVALSGITEDILTIDKKKTETKNSMYFYFIRLMIMKFGISISSKFFNRYETLRNDRNLATLFFSWLSKVSNRSYTRYINNYNYKRVRFYLQNGTLPEGESSATLCTYYLSYKKLYANRYASDYLRTFFDEKGRSSELGIADLLDYNDVYPSWTDITSQNSYFGDQLQKNLVSVEHKK